MNTIMQINKNIENKLDDYTQVSSQIYMDRSLREYLSVEYKDDLSLYYIDAYDYINQRFKDILNMNSGIDSITVYTNNRSLISDHYFIKHIDENVKMEDWYNAVVKANGKTTFSKMKKDKSEVQTFTLTRFLDHPSSLNFQVLKLEIKEKELYSLIDNEDTDREIYVIDEDGYVLTNKNKSLNTKQIADFLEIDTNKLKESGSFNFQLNGKDMLVVYSTMSNGWKTISLNPYEGFLTRIKDAFVKIFIVTAVAIIVAILLIYFTSNLLTKRIETLVMNMKRVEEGDFEVNMSRLGYDEIGELSSTFINMTQKIKKLIDEVYYTEILKKEAEMNTLQSQINPHFLYNTLGSISALAMKEKAHKVYQMVNLLSKFYRISLNKGRKIISIREEIELSKNYLAIQQIRFDGLLHTHFDIDEGLYQYDTIKLVLQPFIENCINHAIWDDENGINIIIKVYQKEKQAVFEIIDDGLGMDQETLENIQSNIVESTSYGIKNVITRLKTYYGNESECTIFSRKGIGTQVKVSVPIIRKLN
ncbi:two-component system sensor histidine kinase YesM [Bacillus niacini]|uniref:Two-component system sensor histidine kinase YesM n=1 Tax=Neobacillus niacini TaxID=86668 RepID=A0A852TK67_9BACI|nr:sensor histidine kinase [Neobacillus niacini]NYE07927.1 two-component system sensor histidine kinase YesM [Neobacillus niacini]